MKRNAIIALAIVAILVFFAEDKTGTMAGPRVINFAAAKVSKAFGQIFGSAAEAAELAPVPTPVPPVPTPDPSKTELAKADKTLGPVTEVVISGGQKVKGQFLRLANGQVAAHPNPAAAMPQIAAEMPGKWVAIPSPNGMNRFLKLAE